jgi:tripartite-type tricarboxylate transporter receptor subunit TctC
MGAPSGTPQTIVSRLNAAIGRTLEQPEIIERLRALGLEPAHSSPQALMQAVTREIAIWTKVVKTGGIKVD